MCTNSLAPLQPPLGLNVGVNNQNEHQEQVCQKYADMNKSVENINQILL